MTGWSTIFSEPFWGSVVQTMLHSIWLAGLVAAVLWTILRFISAAHPNVRYAVCVAALGAIALMPAATWSVLHLPQDAVDLAAPPTVAANTAALPAPTAPTSPRAARPAAPAAARSPWLSRAIATLWFTGAAVMLLINTARLVSAGRLRRQATPITDPALRRLLETIADRLHIRRSIALLSVDGIGTPGVLGILRPALLLPVSVITELPAHELEAIFAHELAHIRRHDYLVNIAQLVIESLLFFNPFVWWVSRQVRQEREACCDAIAVAITGERLGYAEVLTAWAARHVEAHAPATSLAAAFASGSRGHLLDRVKRLLVPEYRPAAGLSARSAMMMLLISGIVGSCVWRGTQEAVAFTARLLTPHERAAKIEQLAKEHDIALAHDAVAPINGRIRGAIRWPDGRLFTGPFQLLATRDGGGLGGVTITVTDGRFDQAIPSGTWRLVGGGSGVAAVMTPEHTLHPYQTIENMEVVVDTGDSVDVRVVDERGEPVAHADVTVTIAHWKQGPTQRCVTDADGRGQLEHIGHARLTARVLAEGFEIGGDHEVIEPGKPLVIRVRREAKLAGTVVDDAGQPVERARVRVVGHSSPLGLTWSGGVEGQDVITGSDGRFALKHIAHERRYVLLADKQNMQRATLTVDAGIENAALSLGRRPNELRGRIIGGLERLPIVRGQPRLAYINTVWPGGRKFHYEATVEVRNGVGYFTLKNLLPTDLEVPLAGYKATLAHGLPGELVLDLSKSPEPAVKRKVIVRLLVDRDAPPAAGTLMVWSHPQHGPVTNDRLRPFVRDNQIEFDATAPGRLIITPDGLQHYWFKSYDQSIDASSDPLRINLPVLPAGAITGIIRPAAGQKLDRFTSVQAFEPLTGTTRDVHIHGLLNLADADGRFMITPLPLDRDYLITTHDGSGGHAWQSPPIHLDAAYPMHELSIQLERGQNAELLVLDPDRQPLRQVPVALHYRYTRGVGGVAGGRTDGRGRYTFTNLSSTISQYTARISPDRDFAAQQVTLNPGGPVQVVRLERGGVFEGVIVDDATGLPLPNVHVTAIVNVDGKTIQTHAEAPTNPLGRFRFSTLPRGTFTLSFSRGDTVWDQTQGPFTSGGDSATIRLSAGRPR